jgi:hypothetical protein
MNHGNFSELLLQCRKRSNDNKIVTVLYRRFGVAIPVLEKDFVLRESVLKRSILKY